ncbi:TonB-dependent receptor [Pseudaquidulcibacter saccharophilus]|uniref:TonB-dependent receptor n=1 Tax=Pseudaquidulcibacter saccharophilus TaxID=2831900 RepID=UPI001EFF321B|nr:TonB-dependent receptor [Pseudaquidulcibacter saccharophilus]
MNKLSKNKITNLKLFALMASVSTIAIAGVASAQEVSVGEQSETVVVKGVRGSQLRSVSAKKMAIAQVEAISAEDIGKLPDVTIADSLQRVPGVQIRRDAGEGSTVNLRGLAQTVTLFNGEQYLSAGSIGQAQANFLDVPSQLMNGVLVYKSTDPRTPLAGISGTIDLKTRRPFQFAEGFVLTGGADGTKGKYSDGNDFSVNGLANWRNDKVGVMLSGAYSDNTLGDNYSGYGGGVYSENDWGAGKSTNYISPHGFEVYNRQIQRKRLGISGAFEAKLGEGFTLVAEGFYTKLEEHNRAVGLNISNRWDGAVFSSWLNPTASTPTGLSDSGGTPWVNVSQYDINAQWLNSFTVNRTNNSEAKNFNLELKYDKGGNFTAETRFIKAKANRLSMNGQVQGDLSNWQIDPNDPNRFTLFRNAADRTRGPFYPSSIAANFAGQYSNSIVGSLGGRYINPNPFGMGSNAQLHVDFSGSSPVFSGWDKVLTTAGGLGAGKTTADYMANLDSYRVAAFSSEGNNDASTDMDIAKADGHYHFDNPLFGFIKKIDGGVRYSNRDTSIAQFHLFSNFYAGTGIQVSGDAVPANGCLAQWKAIDVTMNQSQCSAGEMVPDPVTGALVFQGYTVNQPTPLNKYNDVKFITGLGGGVASGIPGFWAVDPKNFDDIVAFQEKVFGKSTRVIIPGQSYDVRLSEKSAYAAAEFEKGNVSGNFGVHIIQTTLTARQNLTGATLAYGDTNADIGDYVDSNTYTDVLPSLNVNIDLRDNMKLRFAASKTMQPLDLGNYGGGVTINTVDDPLNNRRIVSGASASGNIHLDPWRSSDFDASWEWYLGKATMVHAAAFYIDIASFVTGGQILSAPGQFKNSDGSPAASVPIFLPVQGEGGKVSGLELGTRIAFKDLNVPNYLSNFGIDTNYTYSPSSQLDRGLDGKKLPFNDNSKHQYNLVGWYQTDKIQLRLAYNYRSERLNNVVTMVGNSRVPIYADATNFVDFNATYNVNDKVSIYLNASNVTGEIETYNYKFSNSSKQFAFQNEFERRLTLGVRAKW